VAEISLQNTKIRIFEELIKGTADSSDLSDLSDLSNSNYII
jgi:hypothetical protein